MKMNIRRLDDRIPTGSRGWGTAALATALAGALLLAAAPASAQKCEAGKNQTSGKCAAKAEKGLVLKGDADKYAAALVKCSDKLDGGFTKLEDKGDCPTTGDAASVQDFLDVCTQSVAQALADGTPLPDLGACATCSGDLATCEGDLTTCDGDLTTCEGDLTTCGGDLEACESNSGGGVLATGQTTSYGAGSDGDVQAGTARSFTDNGDGTITDNATGLMWEKKSDDGSIHDKNNEYTWSTDDDAMDGTMVTTFLADLNSGGGFAGYTDWRITNLHELETLRNLEAVLPAAYSEFNDGCTGGCTVTT